MTPFNINLIREQSLTYKQRVTFYLEMVLYLFTCGVLLTIVTYRATTDIMDRKSTRRRINTLNKQFRDKYTEEKNMPDYLKKSCRNLKRNIALQENTSLVLAKHRDLTPILYAVAVDMKKDMCLTRFQKKSVDTDIEIDLYCNNAKQAAQLTASDLIAQWKTNAILTEYIAEIKPARIQRQVMGTQNGVMFRFIAVLKQQGE